MRRGSVREREATAILEAAAGSMSSVNPLHKAHLGAAIKGVTRRVEVENHYERIGWDKDLKRYLMPGREPRGTKNHLINQMSAYGVGEHADITQGLARRR